MSLKAEIIPAVPENTLRVAKAAFPKGNIYMKMRDELGTFYQDSDFTDLFSTRGQPAFSPWRLALIIVMQFAEGLSDRQAAEAVRSRIDWKYALSLELEDAGFDFSILSEFRTRLVEKNQESALLDKMLEHFKNQGWLKARGKQRTDSTHILANVRHLNRLESVTETLRAALNEIAKVDSKWLYLRITDGWLNDYSRRIEEYRLPKGEEKRNEYASLVGSRTLRLLTLIEAEETPIELKKLKMVKALRQMWDYQFEIRDGKVQFRAASELPPVGERFDTPYDTEARYGNKRATTWSGYKVHYTETCDEDCPSLICNVETMPANIPDVVMGEKIHQSLQNKDLLPNTHLVDAGYVEIKWIIQSAKDQKVKIIGPMRPNNQWQALSKNGFALADFQIDWENKRVTCPMGQISTNWYERSLGGVEGIRVRFKRTQCKKCEKRSLCTRSVLESRSLGFFNKENHLILEELRTQPTNPEWQKVYNQRAGIEGTFSQAVRSFDLRKSRYLGEKKTHLHNLATAAAINLTRSNDWIDEKPREKTRNSWFAKLKHLEL